MPLPSDIFLDTLVADPSGSVAGGSFIGSATAVYPNLYFLGKRTWDYPVWIVALQFSTSLTVYPTDFGGLLITFGQTRTGQLAVGQGLQSVIAHVTAPNSLVGPPAIGVPSSKVSNITFGGCGYHLEQQKPISLYGFAAATTGNSLFSITSIQYRKTGG